jgi:hypothetical protein
MGLQKAMVRKVSLDCRGSEFFEAVIGSGRRESVMFGTEAGKGSVGQGSLASTQISA